VTKNQPGGCGGCLAKIFLLIICGFLALYMFVPRSTPQQEQRNAGKESLPIPSPPPSQSSSEPETPHTMPPATVSVDFSRLVDIDSDGDKFGKGQQVKLKLTNHGKHPVMAVAGIYTFRDRQRKVIHTEENWLPFAGGEDPQDWLQPGSSWLTPHDEGFRFFPQIETRGVRAAFVDVTVTTVYLRGPIE